MVTQDLTSSAAGRSKFALAIRLTGWAAVLGLVALSAIITKEATHLSDLAPLAQIRVAEAAKVDDQNPTIVLPNLDGLPLAEPSNISPVIDPLGGPAAHDLAVEVESAPPAAAPVVRTDLVDDTAIRYFNGRPMRPAKTIRMNVSAYSPDARSCDDSADGITSSNHDVFTNAMRMAAADSRVLPLGTVISVPGYDEGRLVPVLDRGGAIKGSKLDLLYPTHEAALRWGRKSLSVTVWEYADGLPADDFRKIRDSKN